MRKNNHTYGLEIEKPISDKLTGASHGMSQNVFANLFNYAQKREKNPHKHQSDLNPDKILGVISEDLGEQGVDNGFNLQETALPYQYDLSELAQLADLDLKTIQKAVSEEGATIINMSNHPLCKTDKKTYEKMVAPKSLYRYILHRGWTHAAGIDARAQNSPATGVDPQNAADAVSVIIGCGAAFIGLFANSPISDGKVTEVKESRLDIWKNMIGSSKVVGDLITSQYPKKRFRTMAQYFNWMFGKNTGIHFVVDSEAGYKHLANHAILIEGNPPVLEYLAKDTWKGKYLNDVLSNKKHSVNITPQILHMEVLQFAQFAGARIRYGLNNDGFPIQDFVRACKSPKKRDVENIFEKYSKFVYIEGRDSGANVPDAQIRSAGKNIANSVVISPSAIQAGLLQNLSKATKLIDSYNWEQLGELRDSAVKNGLQGQAGDISVKDFTRKVIEIAGEGLNSSESWMLSYPEWVLKTGKNGADRALDFISKHKNLTNSALVELVKSRAIILE